MITAILLLIFSLALIIAGANYLTDGAVVLARKARVSELVIGLTIVAIGTSAPELVVSVLSAVHGNSEIALGNVIGSNVFNGLMIIGICSMIAPIMLSRENTFKNIPLCVGVTLLLCLMCAHVLGVNFMPDRITRFGGIVLLAGFVLFLFSSVKGGRIEHEAEDDTDVKPMSLFKCLLLIALGLGGLIWGGSVFLKNAVALAQYFGVSEYVISVTIVAFGTSAPELATCVVAALKGRSQLSIGNVVGSNISNILLVIGAAATISPLKLGGIGAVDILVLFFSSFMIFFAAYTFTRHKIGRGDGLLLILIYVAYLMYLLNL